MYYIFILYSKNVFHSCSTVKIKSNRHHTNNTKNYIFDFSFCTIKQYLGIINLFFLKHMVCIINKYIITKMGFGYAKVKYNCYSRV